MTPSWKISDFWVTFSFRNYSGLENCLADIKKPENFIIPDLIKIV